MALFENKEEKQVAGSLSVLYFNELAARGASFTASRPRSWAPE